MEKKNRRCQTMGEEIANSVSHGMGALLALVGAVVLIVRSAAIGNGKSVASLAAYGVSLVILYTASAVYHAVRNERIKAWFRVMDHCSIFILILGTYIPMSLLVIGGRMGWLLFLINTALAVIGITLTTIDLKRFDKFNLVLYAMMGWLVVIAMKTVVAAMAPVEIALLAGGGVAYTVGILFYRSKRSYMHFVWHLFVLTGSVLQYLCIVLSCL